MRDSVEIGDAEIEMEVVVSEEEKQGDGDPGVKTEEEKKTDEENLRESKQGPRFQRGVSTLAFRMQEFDKKIHDLQQSADNLNHRRARTSLETSCASGATVVGAPQEATVNNSSSMKNSSRRNYLHISTSSVGYNGTQSPSHKLSYHHRLLNFKVEDFSAFFSISTAHRTEVYCEVLTVDHCTQRLEERIVQQSRPRHGRRGYLARNWGARNEDGDRYQYRVARHKMTTR